MGLKEKTIKRTIEEDNIPYHQSNYTSVTDGGQLNFDINWEDWLSDHEGILNLNGYVLQRFTDSLNPRTANPDVKEALREGLKAVKIERAESPAEKEIAFEDDVLRMKVSPKDGFDGVFSQTEIADTWYNAL